MEKKKEEEEELCGLKAPGYISKTLGSEEFQEVIQFNLSSANT